MNNNTGIFAWQSDLFLPLLPLPSVLLPSLPFSNPARGLRSAASSQRGPRPQTYFDAFTALDQYTECRGNIFQSDISFVLCSEKSFPNISQGRRVQPVNLLKYGRDFAHSKFTTLFILCLLTQIIIRRNRKSDHVLPCLIPVLTSCDSISEPESL